MKKGIYISLILAVLIGATVLLERNRPAVEAKLDEWKLMPKKEHFTELYFVTYPTLAPSNVVAGTKIPFSFEIHNVEGKDTDYPYMAYFKASDQRTLLIDRGTISLKDGEKRLKEESFTIGKAGLVGNVVVYLSNLDRYVYFSVPNKNLMLYSAPITPAVKPATTTMATTTASTTASTTTTNN